MPHNPSRQGASALEAADQVAVDVYQPRSAWVRQTIGKIRGSPPRRARSRAMVQIFLRSSSPYRMVPTPMSQRLPRIKVRGDIA